MALALRVLAVRLTDHSAALMEAFLAPAVLHQELARAKVKAIAQGLTAGQL